MADMSMADYAALSGNSGLGGNNWAWIIILFLIFGGGAGFGFGGQALTRAELAQGFNDNNVMRKLDGVAQGLADGFYAQNTTMLNGFNHIGQEIANNRFASQQCCCETNRNIDNVRYENAKNTCDIIQAGHNDTQKILDYLTQNKIDSLRTELQSAQLQLGNLSQTQTILSSLLPTPKPAYVVQSPFATYGCNPCCQYA